MLGNSHQNVLPTNEADRAHLESLVREDFARCHPGETLDDIKRRASFSKEDKGLLRDWMAVAARRTAADPSKLPVKLAASGACLHGSNPAAGRTPKSFGLSIRSAGVYLSRALR